MKYRLFFITLLTICLPATSHAQVLFSEVAWMGSDTNPAHEWIELYNFSNTPTDLTGWTLTSGDGAIDITLSGTLSPHGVGVLERDGDSSVPSVTALLIYSGEMADSGTTLTLKDPAGTTADQAPGGTNWTGIGGINTTPKKTSQRTRMGTWITAAPTPGLENPQVSDPLPDVVVGTTTTTTAPTVGGNTVTRRGGGSSKKNSSFTVTVVASTTAYTGKPATFKAVTTKLDKTNLLSQSHYWNFGDTVTSTGTKVTHSFEFPGEYVVMVESSTTRNKSVYTRHDITVLPHALALATTTEGNIVITNVSAEDFTLDGYTLSGGKFELVFPRNNILKSKASITLARAKVGNTKTLEIIDRDDFVVARLALQDSDRLATATPTNTEVKAAAGKRVVPYVQPAPATVDKSADANTPTVTPKVEAAITTVAEPGLLNKIVSKIVHVFQW